MPRTTDLFNELHATLGKMAEDLASYESGFKEKDVEAILAVRLAVDAAHHDFTEAVRSFA